MCSETKKELTNTLKAWSIWSCPAREIQQQQSAPHETEATTWKRRSEELRLLAQSLKPFCQQNTLLQFDCKDKEWHESGKIRISRHLKSLKICNAFLLVFCIWHNFLLISWHFPLYSWINKSAVNGYVRVRPYPWVSTHHTSIPLEWLRCRFLMLLFAGGGLWKMRLVATGVPTTSGAWYLTEFTLVKCSGVAGVRWDLCYTYPQMSPRGKSLNERVISSCKLRPQYLQNLLLICKPSTLCCLTVWCVPMDTFFSITTMKQFCLAAWKRHPSCLGTRGELLCQWQCWPTLLEGDSVTQRWLWQQ